MEGELAFGVLGPLEVRHGDEPLELPRRKERQLVTALLLNANRVVTTDLLIQCLWSEDAPAKPLTSLRACVSNVRKMLVGPDGEQPLVTDRGGYLLHVPSEALDSLTFEQLVSDARRARAGGDTAQAAELLDHALALVRGEPLADMAYDEFTQREVDRLVELIASAHELRAQVAVEQGEAAVWLPRIGELIAAHPLREQLQATRMVALYQLGRQADALRCYSDHRRAMIDELGIEPSPELQDLEAKILAQDESLLPVGQGASQPPAADQPAAAGVSASTPPSTEQSKAERSKTDRSIVGRDTELAVLAELAENPPGHAFIVGEAGSGKSTLVNSFFEQLASSGWRTARALCPDDDGVPPLWPWRQIFRDLDLGDAAAVSPDQGLSRFEIVDDLAANLIKASATAPLAVFVDDLQWADQDSLKLVTHLTRQLRSERVLIVGAARATPAELSGLTATWIELKSLTADDVVSLLEQLTGEPGDAELAADLWRRTGGNAYFVTELIEFARRFGDEVQGDLEIPSHVRELVAQRVSLLPAATQEVLETAALELQNFSVDAVAEALGRPVGEVAEQLQPAFDSGIVVPDITGYERFRFDHAIAQETVADRADPATKVRRHAALGKAIEKLAGNDADLYATQLSRHYGLGAPSGTAEQAMRWAELAAKKASEIWSHRDAVTHLQRALEADRHLEEPNHERRCRLLIDLGIYSRILGDVTTADEALLDAYRLSEQVGEPLLAADVAAAMSEGVGLAHWRWYWQPASIAVSNLGRVLGRLGPGDSAVKVMLQTQLASDGYAELGEEERSSLIAEAVGMADRLDQPGLLSRTLHAKRIIEGWTWDADRVLSHDRDVLARYEEEGLESQAQQVRGMVMTDLLTRGDLAGAKRALQEFEDRARLRGSLSWRYYATSWKLLFAQLQGDWELANQLSADALDPVTGLGEEFSDSITNQQLISYYFQGRFEDAIPVLQLGVGFNNRPLISHALFSLLAVAGQTTEAEALLDTIDPKRPEVDAVGGRIPIAIAAEALAIIDRTTDLPAMVEMLRPAASALALGNPGLGGLIFYGPIRHHLAMALTALDRFDEAASHIALGRQLMASLEATPHLLRFDFVEAMSIQRKSGTAAARTPLEEVQAAASDAGMFGLAAQAERLLAR